MSAMDKTFTMPDVTTMNTLLNNVFCNTETNDFYFPVFYECANRIFTAKDVVLMFTKAMDGYFKTGKVRMFMTREAVWNHVPEWVDALVPDREIAEAAKQMLNMTRMISG
jgi:hypothetical protein